MPSSEILKMIGMECNEYLMGVGQVMSDSVTALWYHAIKYDPKSEL